MGFQRPTLAQGFRNRDIDLTPAAQAFASAAQDLELPHSFAPTGPAAKIRALQRANPSEEALSLFLNTGSQLNTLRQVQLCLRSVAAGVQRWASFCDLIECAYFHPRFQKMCYAGAPASTQEKPSLYLSHLGKAFQLLNIPPAWYNNAVRGVARGMGNDKDRILKFENYIFRTLFRKLIARESIRSECGRLFYLAYVFIPRLPSEALPAVRAGPHEPLLPREKIAHQSALGLRTFPDGPQRLVHKLKTRRRLRGGAILHRPCFCDSDTLATHGISPIRDFWRIICASTDWGSPLFPSLRKRNIDRILKGAPRSMGIPDANAYSTHAFRRGASMELNRCSDTLSLRSSRPWGGTPPPSALTSPSSRMKLSISA